MAFSLPQANIQELEAYDIQTNEDMMNRNDELFKGGELVRKSGELFGTETRESAAGKGSEPGQKAENGKFNWGKADQEVSFFSLFKYADWKDMFLMTFGFFGAVGDGLSLPIALFICSGLINAFGSNASDATINPAHFEKTINKVLPLLKFNHSFTCVVEPTGPRPPCQELLLRN